MSKGRGGRLLGPGREGGDRLDDEFSSRRAVDASSVPAGRAESDSGASAASGTDQGNGDDPPAVLPGREAHELSSWGRLPPTVRGRIQSQRQHLEDESIRRMLWIQREVENAMSAGVQE